MLANLFSYSLLKQGRRASRNRVMTAARNASSSGVNSSAILNLPRPFASATTRASEATGLDSAGQEGANVGVECDGVTCQWTSE